MIVSYILRVPIILLSCTFGACSSSGGATPNTSAPDSTGGNSGIEGEAPVSVIQGDWAADCYSQNGDPGGLLFVRQSLSVSGPNITRVFATFSDSECTVPQEVVGISATGSISQARGVTVPSGETVNVQQGVATAVDFYFAETTLDNELVSDQSFGTENYRAEVIYDIVFVSQEDRLFFGDSDQPGHDATTAAQRPDSLDVGFSYGRLP